MEKMIMLEEKGKRFLLTLEEAKTIIYRGINKKDLKIEEFSVPLEEGSFTEASLQYRSYCVDDADDLLWEILLGTVDLARIFSSI